VHLNSCKLWTTILSALLSFGRISLHVHDSPRCRFGDRIDCVSDFEVEMVQVCVCHIVVLFSRYDPSKALSMPADYTLIQFLSDHLIYSARARAFT
jgi:transposase InsO family protein